MTSWEEDELFKQYHWEKDLIKHQYMSPNGYVLSFDDVMDLGQSADGEKQLVVIIKEYGYSGNI